MNTTAVQHTLSSFHGFGKDTFYLYIISLSIPKGSRSKIINYKTTAVNAAVTPHLHQATDIPDPALRWRHGNSQQHGLHLLTRRSVHFAFSLAPSACVHVHLLFGPNYKFLASETTFYTSLNQTHTATRHACNTKL